MINCKATQILVDTSKKQYTIKRRLIKNGTSQQWEVSSIYHSLPGHADITFAVNIVAKFCVKPKNSIRQL